MNARKESPGGTPLNKSYRYLPPQRAGFWGLFGLKTGIHFAHFGLESGMVFEGTTGVYERIYRFEERNRNMRIRNVNLEKCFICALILAIMT